MCQQHQGRGHTPSPKAAKQNQNPITSQILWTHWDRTPNVSPTKVCVLSEDFSYLHRPEVTSGTTAISTASIAVTIGAPEVKTSHLHFLQENSVTNLQFLGDPRHTGAKAQALHCPLRSLGLEARSHNPPSPLQSQRSSPRVLSGSAQAEGLFLLCFWF